MKTSYETAVRLNGQYATGLKRTKAEEERDLFDNRAWIRRDLARVPSSQGPFSGQVRHSWSPDSKYDLHVTPLDAGRDIYISINNGWPPATPPDGAAESRCRQCWIGTPGETESTQTEARLSRIATIRAAFISAVAAIIAAIIARL
jgi:hypothetical protein